MFWRVIWNLSTLVHAVTSLQMKRQSLCHQSGSKKTVLTDKDPQEMFKGVPKTAQHLVIHGFFSFTPTNSHPQIVVAMQFLLQGGIPLLAAYSFVPMTLQELTKVLYANLLANKKCVIVNNVLYPCIGSMS